ncbi:MAG: ATP-binding cassette domain-containing protein [Spirochaetes bacterium]|nr:ATP-binding cassette domain-containing protein [Spirochaetota bacterium]
MLSTENVSLQYGKRVLFDDVSIKFIPGNCYGLIGANGSGKSTFLKILSGEIESTRGTISTGKNERIAVLKQNQFEFDDVTVLNTVLMGHRALFTILSERDALYAKPDFSDADGMRSAELEDALSRMNGYDAPQEAATLLNGLSIPEKLHEKKMGELDSPQKVRVLLAQALFGNPDILLLDEPTNNLDIETVEWLEDFLIDFKNTVVVVSHDRHFLDRVCTHVADIDFGKITMFTGNYSFWKQSSELALRQRQEYNRKMEAKIEDLKEFIARFSANASKSRQATSRRLTLDKITLEDIKPSSRKYPYVGFKADREAGNIILSVEGLSKKGVFKNVSFEVGASHKIAFTSRNKLAVSALLAILAGEEEATGGTITWGTTISKAFFPKDISPHFTSDMTIIDWLRQYTEQKDEQFIRQFLGRMLFSGDEPMKNISVLSGGEKVRCMLARMMLVGANVLIFDDPTNHLDLESISSLNDGMAQFKGNILFTSHDHELMATVANRVIELGDGRILDKEVTYDEFLHTPEIKEQREKLYGE